MNTKLPFTDNRGFTLIELLAALTLTIMVLGVFFNVLQNSINAYDRTNTHNRLRQEANLVLTSLTEIQRKWPLPYEMNIHEGAIELIGTSENRTISSSEFNYSLTINDRFDLGESPYIVRQSGYHLSLTIHSKQNENESYTLSTSIDRVKGD